VIDDSCCVRIIFPNPFVNERGVRRRGTRGIAGRASSVFSQPMLSQAVVFIRVSFSLMRFHGS